MHPETTPAAVLFAESQRLGAFVDFWRQRVEIETAYIDNLSGLRIPNPPGKGQLQELTQKTRELLLDELEERRRGFAKLNAAYKALTDEFWTEEGPSHFDIWGGAMKQSLLLIDSLAAEVATAESLVERSAAEARQKEHSSMSSSAKTENQPRSNVLSRLLDKIRNEKPSDTSRFLSADSTYRQKVQKLNDEKYKIQNEAADQTAHYAEHDRKCVVALKQVVSVFSAMHSDLAQVLNITSSQLCIVSSSVDASMESASIVQRLEESFPSWIQPHRYTSYDTSSSLRPTTMLFGCPLRDDFDNPNIGQRAVIKAFETILNSAAKIHPGSLYEAICDANKQQGNDIKLSALQLESLWDPSQPDGGLEAVDYLTEAPSAGLLVYFLTRLPEPFLPIRASDIKRGVELTASTRPDAASVTCNAGDRKGTAGLHSVVSLFRTLRAQRSNVYQFAEFNPEGVQILVRETSGLLTQSDLARWFSFALDNTKQLWIFFGPYGTSLPAAPHYQGIGGD